MAVFGLVLLIQGVGGLINNLASDSKSWFVLNYAPLPLPVRFAGHAVLVAIGMFLVVRTKGWRWLLDDRD